MNAPSALRPAAASMLVFDLDQQGTVAPAIATMLGHAVAPHESRRFDDGEFKHRPLVDPAGADVYVVHGLHGDAFDSPHDKLMRLLMFVGTLRDHGAARVSAVIPYLAYARKDRRTKPFDPLSLRYVAQMFESVGTQQVIALEVHNVAAFENAFRGVTVHLESHHAFADPLSSWKGRGSLAVASPDPGGVKRAQLWREGLEARLAAPVGFAMCDKRRSGGQLSGPALVAGDVDGATVVLVDDLIVSGQTLKLAARALREAGARTVVACAAHGVFSDAAGIALLDDAIAEVAVCDSVPPPGAVAAALRHKLRIVPCAALFAAAIRRSHDAWACR